MSKRSNSLTRQDAPNVSSPATSVSLPPTPVPFIANDTPATISPMSTALVSPSQIQKPVMQRNVPPFLNKLYNMVCDPASNDLIRWSEDGTSFIVTRQQELANQVLPRFFKHGNFSSFVRQLNMYGFHKVPHLQQGVLLPDSDAEQLEFSNPNFQRDQPDLLLLVTRKKGRDPDEKEQGNVDFQHIMDEITAIKKHQMSISTELKNIQRDNQVLWQETLAARERHQRHQETIDKILRFLASVFSNDKKRSSIPRKRRLLIGDGDTDYSQYPLDADETDEERPAKITRVGSIDIGDVLKENETVNTQPPPAVNPNAPSSKVDDAPFTAPTGNEHPMPTFDFSTLTQAQQMQGLQQLLSLAQNNPSLLSQLTGNDAYSAANATIAPMTTTTTSASTAMVPGLDPGLLGGLDTNTSSKDTHLTTTPSLVDTTKSIDSAMKTADSISQDIDQLGVDIEALAQQLGFDPSKHDNDELDYVDLDAFLNNYGGPQPSSAPPSPNTGAVVNADDITGSSASTPPTSGKK